MSDTMQQQLYRSGYQDGLMGRAPADEAEPYKLGYLDGWHDRENGLA